MFLAVVEDIERLLILQCPIVFLQHALRGFKVVPKQVALLAAGKTSLELLDDSYSRVAPMRPGPNDRHRSSYWFLTFVGP